MAVNKVEFGNQTIMDITDTSATPDGVVEGQVFYSAAGVRSTGTLTDATQEIHGLMSAADKVKLDQLAQVPIDSKSYTGVVATSNDNVGGGFFYLKVRPTEYASNWHIKTRVVATVPNDINYKTDTIFDFYGYNNSASWYACINNIRNTSYRGIYYNSVFFTNSTGYNNNCGHWIGFNLIYAQSNTSLARNVTVELLEYDECIVELQDTLITPTNIPDRAAHTSWYSSTNTSFSNYDACNAGLKQTGDNNTTTISNLVYGNGNHVADSALYRYQLVFQKDENTLTPLNNANNVTGTSKTMLTEIEFNPFGKIFYYSSTTNISANGAIGVGSLYYSISGLDLRYSLNCGTTLTAHKPLYLVVTPTGNEKCKIASVTPWAQTLPDFDDGNWYILLGRTYSTYQMSLYPIHPIYKHNGITIQTVTPQDIPSASSTDNGKILKVVNGAWTKADEQDIDGKVTGPASATDNAVAIFDGMTGKIIKNSGYTIGKSVPSNAVFTDTTTTSSFSRPSYQAAVTDLTVQSLVNDLRANHLAFLPPDQVIIEQTIDGGQTWTDAGISDDGKRALFAETRPSINIPRLNGQKSTLCSLRVTFTAMKYDVPANTPETQKYNYWNSNYVLSAERYNDMREMYFWMNAGPDKVKVKVECATGANPTGWVTAFENNNALLSGWSGNDFISLNGRRVFGGSITQKSNFWNYRITFTSAYNAGTSEFTAGSITGAQAIQEIRGYGTNWWTAGNKYASSDHMYSWDSNKNVVFPAKVTATNFEGNVNGYTIAASVPAGAIFTDTTYESKAAASGGTAISLVTTGEKYTWNNKYTKPSGGIPASDLAETYLTSFTETDPTVPSWAKAASKPSYTASEVGALPSNTTYVSTVNGQSGAVTVTIPTKVSDLTDDSGHYTKPSGGIPASDLASGVIPDISGKLNAPVTAGTSGQVLTSDGNGGQTWQTPSAGTITDVQVNGSTVVSNGIASITLADELPIVTSTDEGSFLRVVNGTWAVAAISEANGESF